MTWRGINDKERGGQMVALALTECPGNILDG